MDKECWQVKDLIAYLEKLPPEMRVEYEDCEFDDQFLGVKEEDGEKYLYIGSGAWIFS